MKAYSVSDLNRLILPEYFSCVVVDSTVTVVQSGLGLLI